MHSPKEIGTEGGLKKKKKKRDNPQNKILLDVIEVSEAEFILNKN